MWREAAFHRTSAFRGDGKPHSAHSTVLIDRVVGSVFCVRKSMDERFRDLALSPIGGVFFSFGEDQPAWKRRR